MTEPDNEWKPLDLSSLRDRLLEVRTLLMQAAAVGAAQDVEKLEALRELETLKQQEQVRGRPRKRRYR